VIAGINCYPGLLHRLKRSRHSHLTVAVHVTGIFSTDIVSGVKSFYLTGDPGVEGLGVKVGNIINTGLASDKTFPRIDSIQTKRTYNTYPGDRNSII